MRTKSYPLLALAAGLALSQPVCSQEPAPGVLLISTSALDNSMFEETVMLVLHHDDDGSIAIMLNRPTNLAPAEVFPDIEGAGSYTGVLYFGGPVSPTRPFMLMRRNDAVADTGLRIIDDVYLSADASLVAGLDQGQRSETFLRIYAGSAQWGPGQLVAEIDAGAWEMTLANTGTIFTDAPGELWQRLLAAPHGTDVAGVQVPGSPQARAGAR